MSDVVFFIIAEAEEIYKTILKFNWAGEDAAGMASGRWVSHALSAGAEDSDKLPHHTGHGPFRTRPPGLS